jgi:hypothetical protein
MKTRFIHVVVGMLTALALVIAPAYGGTPTPQDPAGKILGVIPPHGNPGRGNKKTSGTNLTYHGGPVMHTNATYAIYWVPPGFTVSAGYQATIDQFLGDVAAAPGATTNVYFSDTQYSDSVNGPLLNSSTFAGSVIDTNGFPANGCTDPYTSTCLNDSQLKAEITRVMAAQGWSASPTTMFFMLTAKGVGSCAGGCAFSNYCAYHSWFGTGTSTVYYANQPYTTTVPSACGTGQAPNGDVDADSTINVISHEHNETITDQHGNAWYDSRGAENGDKCAWNFGTISGPAGAHYNQTINGHNYYLQQEWSNQTSRCVLTGL